MSCIKQTKVLLGLSGGVDSAVAAATLLDQGYRVTGLYLANGYPTRAEHEAGAVARDLGIPLERLDVASEFRQAVVGYFVSEYLAGRTPNPCAVCNKGVKFRYLLARAGELGCDFVATGHYARVRHDDRQGAYELLKGVDPSKDQSYFLFMLGQAELSRILFPNGGRTKKEIREKALEMNLSSQPFSRESQEICFIPDNDYKRFIRREEPGLRSAPGPVVDREGRVVGRHRGIFGYTVGQRRGLGIASPSPYYVIEIRSGTNEVVVGRGGEQESAGLIAKDVRWVSSQGPGDAGMEAVTKIRYRHAGAESTVFPLSSPAARASGKAAGVPDEGAVLVRFRDPQRAVAPGQAAVFYRGERLLGGGWIVGAVGPSS